MTAPGTAMDRRELAARLALLAVPGLKVERALALTADHGSGRAACNALGDECGPAIAAAARTPQVRERTLRALHAIETQSLQVLPFDDPRYPRDLISKLGPYRPPLLFARGDLDLLTLTAVAVVGCRAASEYGLDVAEEIGDAVARAGGCVVSGVALGIDAAAHAAALDAGGATIGVLGCGVDVYYPRRNMELQERIARGGLLLSELLPGEPPRRHQFPHRNRIIAALSNTVVVVEAGEKSGALSTADHAGDQGTTVFAVPNALDRPNMQGIVKLFEEGIPPYTGVRTLLQYAKLIELGDDVPAGDAAVEHPPPGALPARIWSELGDRPCHVDRLAAAVGSATPDVLVTLLQLELDGYAVQLGGGRFVRRRQVRPRRNRMPAAGYHPG